MSEADARLLGVAGDRAGFAVTAGEFDGDGDIAVGAPENDSAAEDVGAVYLLLSNETERSGTANLLAEADAILTGVGEGDMVGFPVASLPVTEADSDSDDGTGAAADVDALLVGAPRNDN
ncbi:hypothetical protein [Halobaculum gomorrense]|uniref:hypothetical protein n=1 Tax=Halobaculum gomorrense TaxID=43928 RepID=UPI0011610B49|nr:hypothetical protein [Halobaculum gomorrense]